LIGNVTGSATTATSASSFTGTLTGDVTGTQGATMVSAVGAVTAANVAAGANLANAATSANAVSTLVKRDAGGNFSAGTITATLIGNASTATTATSATSFSGVLPVANGGSGLSAAPANGQIHIGNGANFTLAGLSSGTGINVLNTAGAITINATADASTKVGKAGDTMTGVLNLPINGLVAGSAQLVLSGGNVGIGTGFPGSPLHVSGHIQSSNPGANPSISGTCASTGGTLNTSPQSSDTRGSVTFSSATSASCTSIITFANTYSPPPICVVSTNASSATNAYIGYTTTGSTLTVTYRAAGTSTDGYSYICMQ